MYNCKPEQLLRTFSTPLSDDDNDFGRRSTGSFLRSRWEDLREKRVVIALGEAGTGKTTELQLEAERLRGQRAYAFFVALNRLTSADDWELALLESCVELQAWKWFQKHLDQHPSAAFQLVKDFARMASDCKWIRRPISEDSIAALVRLHVLLTPHLPASGATVDPADAGLFDHLVTEFRSSIEHQVSQERGAAAHRALVQLMESETDESRRNWLASKVNAQAEFEAAHLAQLDPQELRTFEAAFSTEPKSESQLLLQVLARLEEIKTSIEEGPFSDRNLFRLPIKEAHLQTWLAARFLETQNRRFTVTREEEVDRGNKPDIQLSCSHGKVCVEVKPLYAECNYSANSLNATLKDQIAGKYLKGLNSRSGILVLFRLDDKSWEIPGVGKGQPFESLVAYLQEQASIIAATSGVDALHVLGIDCVGSADNSR